MENTSSISFLDKYFRISAELKITRKEYWKRMGGLFLIIFLSGIILNLLMPSLDYHSGINLSDFFSPFIMSVGMITMFMYGGIYFPIMVVLQNNELSIQLVSLGVILIILSIVYLHFIIARKRINDFGASKTEIIGLYIFMVLSFLSSGFGLIYFTYLGCRKSKI